MARRYLEVSCVITHAFILKYISENWDYEATNYEGHWARSEDDMLVCNLENEKGSKVLKYYVYRYESVNSKQDC